MAWHSCVIQFSLDLVSLFSLIYIVVSSTCYTTPTTTIFSIYFLMQPSGGGKQNEEGVLWCGHNAGWNQEGRRIESPQPASSQQHYWRQHWPVPVLLLLLCQETRKSVRTKERWALYLSINRVVGLEGAIRIQQHPKPTKAR